jgi:hypothetical protein
MALALCGLIDPATGTCATGEICRRCRRDAAAVAHEIARQLYERHGGSSQVADWLDGVGCHPSTVLLAADDVPPVEQSITGNGSGASLPPSSNEPRVGEPMHLWLVRAAEPYRDADLVMSTAARLLRDYSAQPAPAPAVPMPGELGELVQCLRIRAASLGAEGANLSQQGDASYFTRAADIVEAFSLGG